MDQPKLEVASAFTYPHKVSVLDFIDSWSELLSEELSHINGPKPAERNASDLNITASMLKSLQRDLNPKRFCQLAPSDHLLSGNMPHNSELDTLRELNLHNIRVVSDSTYRMQCVPKYRHEPLDKSIGESGTGRASRNKSHVQSPQAVLTVQIFKPAIRGTEGRPKVHLDREFELLSSQPLSALRDAFICMSDILTDRDFSTNPLEPLPRFAGHEKMGFFLIEDALYKDDRFESAGVIQRIVDWAAERGVGHLVEKSMQNTRFGDLTVQLGLPYLYTHGNNCEHLLVFSDLRLFIPKIGDSISRYPKCVASESMHKVKCQMCDLYFSKWLVTDNKRLPCSPFYLCHNCHISFNYDALHDKIGSFQAYPIMINLDQ